MITNTAKICRNLKIEFAVAKMLRSDPILLQRLRKKHTCVKFDFTKTQTIAKVETKISKRVIFTSENLTEL